MIPQRILAVKNEPGLNLILGVSRETIERNVLQPMRELYTDAIVGTINGRNIARICGQDVYCLGAEKVNQVAKIQGTSAKYCYGDEIAKWNREVFAMLQSRLDKPYSKFDGSCNPESPNHWLKAFIDNPDIDAYIQQYTIFDNPFLPPEFVQKLCVEYEGTVYYDRYIKGEWALAEGLIYPMHQEAIVDDLPQYIPIIRSDDPRDQLYQKHTDLKYTLSVDYGTMNAFAALLWCKIGGIWYAIREYYYSGRAEQKQKTDNEYLADLEIWLADLLQERAEANESMESMMRSSPLEKIRVIVDPSAASFIALLRKTAWAKVTPAENSVLDGIRDTAAAMHIGKIKILSSLRNLIKELQGYVWDDKALEDKPLKENDHACDAMRYFVRTMHIVKIHRGLT